MINFIKNRGWLVPSLVPLLALSLLIFLPAATYATQNNFDLNIPAGTMKNASGASITNNSGIVQFISGNPANPPKGKPADLTPSNAQLSAGSLVQSLSAPYTAGVTDVVGKNGSSVSSAMDGGFYISNSWDINLNQAFYVRYWTADKNYYGNSSALVPWTSGDIAPNYTMGYSAFTLYKAAAPFKPQITMVQQSDSTVQTLAPTPAGPTEVKNLIINFSAGTSSGNDNVQIAGNASHPTAYDLQLSKSSGFATVDQTIPTNGTSVTIDRSAAPYSSYFNGTDTYYARAVAYNYFGTTAGDSSPGFKINTSISTPVVGGVTATFTLTAGINTISVPCDPAKQINVSYGSKTVAVSAPATVGKLLTAINSAVGANVGVIGYYDAAAKQHVGLAAITYGTDGTVTGGQVFGKSAASDVLSVNLSQGQALQVTINAAGALTISQ